MDYLLKDSVMVEQFVGYVISYTSRYNNKMSVSYAPDNILGKPVNYPNYGDFPDTYMLRSYGKWWSQLESAQKEYMPQDVPKIISEDYLIVAFEQPVVATKIIIYETYNPGAVVRLWSSKGEGKWFLLWEGQPQTCEPTSRLFKPQIRVVKELIHLIRIELNQSHLNYHTSLDAVLLVGRKPVLSLQYNLLNSGIDILQEIEPKQITYVTDKNVQTGALTSLPYEVIVYIFGFLDLKSLCRCAQVNRTFLTASSDTSLYRNLSLKRYWHKVIDSTLENFTPKCTFLRKLDLSWCGDDGMVSESSFLRFIEDCGQHLTHLALNKCEFVHRNSIETISECKELTDLRLRHLNIHTPDNIFLLANLSHLYTLDLYSSNIDDQSLIRILKSNPGLHHLIIDLCEQLTEMDFIAETISTCNRKIQSFSCWKTHSLTADGIKSLAKCPDLRDLDVGWCLVLSDLRDCIVHLAQGCPNLMRLVISGCRGLVDGHLLPLIQSSSKMKQLDLLGARNISGEICEQLLKSFRELELLDVSFCDQIHHSQVALWRTEYPNVVIQRSCEYVVRDYWYN